MNSPSRGAAAAAAAGGTSVNPYFQFEATVPEAGEFTFTWYDDDGSVYEKKKSIKIA